MAKTVRTWCPKCERKVTAERVYGHEWANCVCTMCGKFIWSMEA